MASSPKPPTTPLAIAALAGSTTLIFQGVVEKQNHDRADLYQDLFFGAQLVVIFLLVLLSFFSPTCKVANITALTATTALKYIRHLVNDPETVAIAAASILIIEALAFSPVFKCFT